MAALAEVAFAAADAFGAMLTAYRRKSKLPSAEPLGKMVREISRPPKAEKELSRKELEKREEREEKRKPQESKKPASVAAGRVDWTEYEKLAIQNAMSGGKHVYHVTASSTRIAPCRSQPANWC